MGETYAAKMAGWRYHYQRCIDLIDSIKKGLEEATFHPSQLQDIAAKLKPLERQVWADDDN